MEPHPPPLAMTDCPPNPMSPRPDRSPGPPSAFLAALLATLTLAGPLSPAPAQQAAPPPGPVAPPPGLSDKRWQDQAYGLSLLPPLDSRLIEQTADQYLLRILDRQGRYQIALSVRQSSRPLELDQVIQTTTAQLRSVQPQLQRTEPRKLTIADRPAALVYFTYPPPAKGPDVMIGYGLVNLDPKTLAVLELNCAADHADPAKRLFEAVLASLELSDPAELARQRQAAIERAELWITQNLSIAAKDRLHAALIPEQYFRILENNRDIGYLRIRQASETIDQRGIEKRGIRIEVQSRLVPDAQTTIDSLAKAFLTDDNTTEIWSVLTTIRRQPPQPNRPPLKQTFVETGLRDRQRIEISVNGPKGNEQRRFQRPPHGYLSQVEARLLAQLLPIDRAATYGFYWYNTATGKMTYRSEQVTPTINGFVITTRLGPNAPPLRATYSADRRLIEQQLSPTRKIVASTRQAILRLWQNRP